MLYEGDLRELVTPPYTEFRGATPVFILCPNHKDENTENLAVYSDHAYCYACGKYYGRKPFSDLFCGLDLTTAKLYSSTHKHTSKPRTSIDLSAIGQSSNRLLLQRLPTKMHYLEERGITRELVEGFEIGHNGVAYVLPVLGATSQGDLETVSLRYRRDDAVSMTGPKYWGQTGYNDTYLYPCPLETGPAVVLTEGEFDALLLRRYGVNAYSFTNGNLALPSDQTLKEWFAGTDHILLWRDQDVPGVEGSKRLVNAFTRIGKLSTQHHWNVELGKDVTELWQRHREAFDKLVALYEELASGVACSSV